MRRHITRALLAAAAAGGAALIIIGTAGAGAASPTTARPAAGASAIATTSQAGYVAVGQNFRFVTTTVVVPPKASYGYAEVVLGGHGVIPATLGVAAGGGAASVRWNVVGPLTDNMAGGTMKLAPKVGDWLTLSIYFNQQGSDYFTVSDLTQKVSQTLNLPAPAHVVYTAAEVACLLPGNVTAPKASIRLWEFGKSAVTTYSGVRGSMLGPWTTRQIIDVATNGHVVMSPWFLWNNGNNFGAWLHPAS